MLGCELDVAKFAIGEMLLFVSPITFPAIFVEVLFLGTALDALIIIWSGLTASRVPNILSKFAAIRAASLKFLCSLFTGGCHFCSYLAVFVFKVLDPLFDLFQVLVGGQPQFCTLT